MEVNNAARVNSRLSSMLALKVLHVSASNLQQAVDTTSEHFSCILIMTVPFQGLTSHSCK